MEKTVQEVNQDAMATIVITMHLASGEVRVAGNILQTKDFAVRMLIEAAYRVISENPRPIDSDPKPN